MYCFSKVLLVLSPQKTPILNKQLLLCTTVVLTKYRWLQDRISRKKKIGQCKQNQTVKLVFGYGWNTFYQEEDHMIWNRSKHKVRMDNFWDGIDSLVIQMMEASEAVEQVTFVKRSQKGRYQEMGQEDKMQVSLEKKRVMYKSGHVQEMWHCGRFIID